MATKFRNRTLESTRRLRGALNGQRVFVNYRREDTSAESGHLFDGLVRRYGRGQVFRDLDGSPPGVSFPELRRQTLRSCHVVLVLIGRNWLAELRRREQGDD